MNIHQMKYVYNFLCIGIMVFSLLFPQLASGASNKLPEGISLTPSLYQNIYIITSPKPVQCYAVSQNDITTVTLNPGDTVLAAEYGKESLNGLSLPGIPQDAELRTIVISVTPPVTAFIQADYLTHSGLRSLNEIKEMARKSESDANYSTIKSLMSGKQNFPFNPFYSLIAIVIAIILSLYIMSKAKNEVGVNNSTARILTVISVVIMILAFAFQLWLFYNGDILLFKEVKGNVAASPMLTLLKVFGYGFGLFIFSIIEVCSVYSGLCLVGELFGGRTHYSGTGLLIWGGGVIGGVVVCLFFRHNILLFAKIMIAILVLDFIILLIKNFKSIPAICLSTPLYAIGITASAISMINGTVITFWLVVTVAAIVISYSFMRPREIVGRIYNGIGELIGEIYDDGMGYIHGRGYISRDEVNSIK